MNRADEMLARVIEWARQEVPIRALVLVGSRAGAEPADELADFDICVFTTTHEPYIQDDGWLSTIDDVWVYIPEKITLEGQVFPTRLVIYQEGTKVDFVFYTVNVVDVMEWDGEYQVLLDKDGITEWMRVPAQVARRSPPTEQDLTALVNEFWFEVYHVAKYLRREELWLAKARDWGTKELLLRMIEWHAQGKHGWEYDTYYMGKHIRSWAGGSTWQTLHRAFARFDSQDSWNGLLATMDLFRQLAVETAAMLGFAYPEAVDRNITGFVLRTQIRRPGPRRADTPR